MKCNVCNSKLESSYKFCPMCGTEVKAIVPEHEFDSGDYPDGFDPKLYGL